MSDLLFIPVPGSSDSGEPTLRVVIVPRLDAAANVAATGMANWPSAVAAARLVVELDGLQLPEVEPRTTVDPDVWERLVGGLRVDGAGTPVVKGAPPLVERTATQADMVEATYRAAAGVDVDPETSEHPTLDAVVGEQLASRWAAPPVAPPGGLGQPTPPPGPAEPDFHRVLNLMREHPAVMRSLGLILELPVDADQLGSAGTVRVLWSQPPAELPVIVSLITAYEVDANHGFLPASTATVKRGLVDVGDVSRWSIATFDVDLAVGRLQDAARTVAAGDAVPRLPALRSAGVSLLRRDRAVDLADRRAVASANAGRASLADAPPLTADDLMLGLRVDVRHLGEPPWQSLCRRVARYTLDGLDIGEPAEEEGHVKAAAAIRTGDDVRADELVVRWGGWSLVAPPRRPGSRANAGRRAQLPFDFDWEFGVPPDSLLPLRFGTEYELRVRAADIAGGGVARQVPGSGHQTPPIFYGRVEPVSPPTLVIPAELDAADLGPGGSVEDLVIRADAADYPPNDARGILPPTTTLEIAEQHGMLDGITDVTLEHVQRALREGLPDPASDGLTVFCRPEDGGLAERTQFENWAGDWPDALPKRLSLLPGPGGGQAITIHDGVVTVRLAPAEQIALELSSSLSDVVQFALHHWSASDLTVQAVRHGRHPMVTPPRVVRLVHAVRRPLGVLGGELRVDREPGAVSAALTVSPPAAAPVEAPRLLGVDPASTARLEISASWTEVDDASTREVTGVPVEALTVGRGQRELPVVRHDFGDTRHRSVRYGLAAVSRFREYFRSDEDAERFVTRTELAAVSVPSSARPPAPSVRAVFPSFRWEETQTGTVTRRDRHGGRLRVELRGPWHQSGANERLAVVVEATEIARDPLWMTAELDRLLSPGMFVDGVESVAIVRPADGGADVTVVPYEAFHSGDSWWADVAIPAAATTSYRPFVRLAVARYQRESLPGLELSEIVRTDLVSVLPDRSLTIDRDGGRVALRLDGLGPQFFIPNRVQIAIERGLSTGGPDLTILDPAAEEDLGAWRVVDQMVVGLNETFTFMRPAGLDGVPLRLRVREIEDPKTVFTTPAPGTRDELAQRIVFTDLVPVP